MAKFAQGRFAMKYPDKYVGGKTPLYRSSWEFAFMRFCDESPSISKWASESIKIPYKHPLNGKFSVYVPDFFIQYKTKKGKNMVELIEVKPDNQTFKESVGKSRHNQLHLALNQAKWEAANKFAKSKGIKFRVITEKDMFHQGKR